MKALEYVKTYKKEFVFDKYTRVIIDFKDYEKITKVKMLEAMYEVYKDPEKIINICTERELKFLQLVCAKNKEYLNKKYDWERTTLGCKFIIYDDLDKIEIYEELHDTVKRALENVNWKEVREKDELNEVLVSYCKIQGTTLVVPLINICSVLLKIAPTKLAEHIRDNLVFNYYVSIVDRYYEELGELEIAVYNDFYDIIDLLDEQRSQQGKNAIVSLDIADYKSLFYNDFNMHNPIIKKFYQKLNELPFFSFTAIKPIQEYALLNLDREGLKEAISEVPVLKHIDLTDFFELMDKAMDEMPSGALNGITPNELKKIEKEEFEFKLKRQQNYTPQQNACLSQKDAKLFYKLYFALLEFTNQKYKINPGYKIYKQTKIDPNAIMNIIEKFWRAKDEIISAFCLTNPYKFSSEEIDIIQKFKQGFREEFILAKYEENYTAIMNDEKIFMIKGINDNIDNIIPYTSLPTIIKTAIIPFKNQIIYDGIFSSYSIDFGLNFAKMVSEEYNKLIKYYHL